MVRKGGHEHYQQDDLDNAEYAVLHKHPDRAAQTDQHAVLKGEDGPDPYADNERNPSGRTVQLGRGRTPPTNPDQDQDRNAEGGARTNRIGANDEGPRPQSGPRNEAGQHAVEVLSRK